MVQKKNEIRSERMAAAEPRKAGAGEKVDLPTRSGAPASRKPPSDEAFLQALAMASRMKWSLSEGERNGRRTFMKVEVNGKSVKFCNGWRGVEGGICDCNSGYLETTEKGEMYGATIYLSTSSTSGFQFAICDRLLTLDELREAERLVQEAARLDDSHAGRDPRGAGRWNLMK
jgi:hypothetical protein